MTGTVPPGGCTVVDVTFDSTGLLPGDYLADLVLDSNDPDEPQVVVPVTMTVLEPVAGVDFTWAPNQPIVGEVVQFTATVAAGSGPLTYDWDFGDGGSGSGPNPAHAYAAATTYTVLLTVTNACGEDYATYDIVVVEGCVGPTGADFTWLPPDPVAGQVVVFTGSTTGGTPPISYAWAFGDGATGAGNPINHTYALSNTYTVMMTATNACGFAPATHDVVVSGEAPPVHMIYLPIVIRQ
jgi:PKD repeat protein